MKTEDIIAFARRDWAALGEWKRRFWADQSKLLQPAEMLAIGDDIRRHVQALNAGWPSTGEREADLDMHVKMSEVLRRVESSTLRTFESELVAARSSGRPPHTDE